MKGRKGTIRALRGIDGEWSGLPVTKAGVEMRVGFKKDGIAFREKWCLERVPAGTRWGREGVVSYTEHLLVRALLHPHHSRRSRKRCQRQYGNIWNLQGFFATDQFSGVATFETHQAK